ncbi:MAG: hemolysin III family protein [Anaerolineales bacterium]|nr:hemolysin III family protein [Anaerolineales bacterium]
MTTQAPSYSFGEELANSITHGIGVVLSIAGLSVLTSFASVFGSVWHIVSCSIYGATQILMYTASTLYHSIPSPRAKEVLRVFDHSAIFLLIAGTYTPFTLVSLRGPWGWTIFSVVWAIAFVGILLRVWWLRNSLAKQKAIWRALPYIGMGWIAVLALKPLFASLSSGGIALVIAGGLAYTLGTIFYIWKKLPYNHAIWHVFVMLGSAFHFFAVLFYVIPLAS